jgi:hypothetical protein
VQLAHRVFRGFREILDHKAQLDILVHREYRVYRAYRGSPEPPELRRL